MTDEATPAKVRLTDGLGRVRLPRTLDVWKPPGPRSARRKIARSLSPAPQDLVYYPELPPFRRAIWCLWRNGQYGDAEYIGGWSYRTRDGFVNEMPVCWCLRPNAELTGRPLGGSQKR